MEENWINIYEIDNFKIDINIWLEDLLRKNNIPYKKEIEEYWDGLITPEYKLNLKVFIPLEYEETVKKYVEEYELNEMTNIESYENFNEQENTNLESYENFNEQENTNLETYEDFNEQENTNEFENDEEVKRYDKIRKIFFRFFMFFLLIILIFTIVAYISE